MLTLIGRGLSNTEIGETLVIGAATTKTHVSRILSKLGARDRAQLVVTAYETGLVTPGSDGARSHHALRRSAQTTAEADDPAARRSAR